MRSMVPDTAYQNERLSRVYSIRLTKYEAGVLARIMTAVAAGEPWRSEYCARVMSQLVSCGLLRLGKPQGRLWQSTYLLGDIPTHETRRVRMTGIRLMFLQSNVLEYKQRYARHLGIITRNRLERVLTQLERVVYRICGVKMR